MNLVGNLLIAPPVIKGSFWYKTVIMITEHHSNGSVGVVLNKRSSMSIENFGSQIGTPLAVPGHVYQGGPISQHSLSFLHSPEWRSKNTLRINQHFSLSSADDIVPRLSMGDHPKYWRMFLGLCGWGPGQLEAEMKGTAPWKHENSWCTSQADWDLVFESDQKDQWCKCLDRSGLEFAQNILL